jgi:hypothetical protein
MVSLLANFESPDLTKSCSYHYRQLVYFLGWDTLHLLRDVIIITDSDLLHSRDWAAPTLLGDVAVMTDVDPIDWIKEPAIHCNCAQKSILV